MSRKGKPVQVWLSEELHARLHALAKAQRRPLSEELRIAIEQHILHAPPPEPVPEPTPAPQPQRKPRKGT